MVTYRGYDYSELFGYLGIADSDDAESLFEESLSSILDDAGNRRGKKDVREIRRFIAALADAAEKWCHWAPVWRGVAAVEDDYTFMQAVYALRGHLWT
jgi:hypothetical protein